MPDNSVSLSFAKMPTVTVDGKTYKFTADKTTGEFQEIKQGNVTYSLKKDAATGKYEMVITGDPKSLEKYNFAVNDGRMTKASFGGHDIDPKYFPGQVDVGAGKSSKKSGPYYQSFSLSGSALASKKDFLKNMFGVDEEEPEPADNADSTTTQVPQPQKAPQTVDAAEPSDKTQDVSPDPGIHVEKNKQEQATFLSRAILKEKAGKLLDKMQESREKLPALKDSPHANRLLKSISRFAEGSSLDLLKFSDPQTEHLFLSSAQDYLAGLEADVDALGQPDHSSLELIEQYPEQFQSAVSEVLGQDRKELNSRKTQEILSSLDETQKSQVLKLFNEFVLAKVASLADGVSLSSQSNPVEKSAELLKNLGLQRQEVPGDGNCFFFAVAANDSRDSEDSSISESPREANTRRDELLETFEKLTPDQAKKSFPGKELFLTWDALQSGLLTIEQIHNAEKTATRPPIDSTSWGNSSHLKLNAIRTGKPQIALDAGSQKIHVYHPGGGYKAVDASTENVKSDLQDFIKEKGAHIYESLPGHWNAAQIVNE